MKRLLICALLLLLTLAACRKYSINSEGSSGSNRARLWDFRTNDDGNSKSSAPPAAPSQDAIAALYPKRLSSPSDCKQHAASPNDVAKMREEGQMAPMVVGESNGSFSDKGKQERAMLIARQECSANPEWMTHEIVIVPASSTPVPIVRADVDDSSLLQT